MQRYARRLFGAVRIVFLLLSFLTAGYALGRAFPAAQAWKLDDLRALDPPDQPDPAGDLTALYVRSTQSGCQLRLDFVDLTDPPVYDVELELRDRRVRISNLVVVPEGIDVQADARLDTLSISLRDCPQPAGAVLRVSTGGDTLGPVAFDGAPPDRRAALSLVFYDTFSPAATPAQALRRWDGAHSGPRGERHGLHDLLNAAQSARVPLSLLDLETPAALSAIDYLGGSAQLRDMQAAGLLDLPAVNIRPWGSTGLALSRDAARSFGLEPGQTVFDPSDPPEQLKRILAADPGDNGLPLSVRRALLGQLALGGSPLLLGGDFEQTTWGTPDYAAPALNWLAARPYIRFARALLPPADPVAPLPTDPVARSVLDAQAALAGADPQLARNYAGVIASLRAAAAWAAHPAAQAGCARLCVLADEHTYAVIDPRGARLVFLFAGSAQLIGPTAQFFVGFSDKSEWDLSKGEGADPQQVMGAFADAPDAFRAYTATVVDATTIRLTAPDGAVRTYRLVAGGLDVELPGPVETAIPLVIDPTARFAAGWAGRYSLAQQPGVIEWGLASGARARVRAPAQFLFSSFDEARPLLSLPEDPDREYPAGIYLPFPMAMLRVSSPVAVVVSIETMPK